MKLRLRGSVKLLLLLLLRLRSILLLRLWSVLLLWLRSVLLLSLRLVLLLRPVLKLRVLLELRLSALLLLILLLLLLILLLKDSVRIAVAEISLLRTLDASCKWTPLVLWRCKRTTLLLLRLCGIRGGLGATLHGCGNRANVGVIEDLLVVVDRTRNSCVAACDSSSVDALSGDQTAICYVHVGPVAGHDGLVAARNHVSLIKISFAADQCCLLCGL